MAQRRKVSQLAGLSGGGSRSRKKYRQSKNPMSRIISGKGPRATASPAVETYRYAKAAERILAGDRVAGSCSRARDYISAAYLAVLELHPKKGTAGKKARGIVDRVQDKFEKVCIKGR